MKNQDDVRAAIADDPDLADLQDRVTSACQGDPAHDLGHVLRVALWTARLGDEDIDLRAAIAAGLLHDIVNHPKTSEHRKLASRDSAEMARQILPKHGFSSTGIEEIASAIADHSYSRGAVPGSALGKALQDADRLDALGALGVMRAVATGVRLESALLDPEDPWAVHRSLDDHHFTLDHFFTKLLRLPQTMQTSGGRREAEARVEFMISFLRQLGIELGAELPPPWGST